jgi:Type II secretion system (T2SS), protein E, N-terminal domain
MNNAAMEQRDETANRTALGTLLIERGFLDAERLDEALRIGADTGERLGEVVVRMGWASEDDLAKTLADQWKLRYVERSAISFDGDALSRMSREEATRLEALPMRVSEDGAVVVALAEPTDARFFALHELLGDRIDCVVVAKSAIDAGLRSDLLPKDGSSAPAVVPVALVADVEEETVNGDGHEGNGVVVTPEIGASADEATASDFDEVARTLSDGLSAQLDSLRAIVVEAESGRERDRSEIARLTAELADRSAELNDRAAELADRNGTIESMQQKLRELADSLEHRS